MQSSNTSAASQTEAAWRRNGLVPPTLATIASLIMILAGRAGSDWWQVVVLGVVEGITEFLPISSTGHLLIAADLLGFQHSVGGTFEIFIQLGAVLAVVGFYARDLLGQARELPHDHDVQRFWLAVLVAFLPAAVIGLAVRGFIKTVLFESPQVIAGALIVGGVVLIAVERLLHRRPTVTSIERIHLPEALAIGLAQVTALIPGVSRSGASMVGGLFAGLDRVTATTFSFYLAIPTLGAATVLDLLGSLDQLTPSDLGRLLLGMLVSFVVAWLCIGWLLRYVARNSFTAFGVYRIAAGIVILGLVFAGRL
jgi:undecaprenyl-diphosphatase